MMQKPDLDMKILIRVLGQETTNDLIELTDQRSDIFRNFGLDLVRRDQNKWEVVRFVNGKYRYTEPTTCMIRLTATPSPTIYVWQRENTGVPWHTGSRFRILSRFDNQSWISVLGTVLMDLERLAEKSHRLGWCLEYQP